MTVIPISVPSQHDGIKLYEERERGREARNDAALRMAHAAAVEAALRRG